MKRKPPRNGALLEGREALHKRGPRCDTCRVLITQVQVDGETITIDRDWHPSGDVRVVNRNSFGHLVGVRATRNDPGYRYREHECRR